MGPGGEITSREGEQGMEEEEANLMQAGGRRYSILGERRKHSWIRRAGGRERIV